ncbi:MAG: exo-beta-N-acetylmuramidase NamZ domain-containing protein [Betaproteobacteria bacterium]
MRVRLGSERLLDSGILDGCRVGLVCNPASVGGDWRHVADRLAAHPRARLAALFGPQHGFRSDVQDNMIETRHARDEIRRVPVYSLYSETREPTADMLRGLDLLVVDLQDVGSRIYTFVYTMANCLKGAKRHGVKVIVCDRPNPIGGTAVEGPMLVGGYESFVGQYPVPMRHGMTIGELANLFNERFGIGAALEVVPMDGWRREMYYDDTGLPWIMPSPNMPTLDSAIVYPGTVLFEGTNVSEGRGTTRPFELVGAPWAVAERLADAMNRLELPGAYFRPVVFDPTFQKHAGTPCGGCQIHVLDRDAFRPVETGVALIGAFRASDPARFRWRDPPYEYETKKLPIDILAGSGALREAIEAGQPARDIAASWTQAVDAFDRVRREYLIYGTA